MEDQISQSFKVQWINTTLKYLKDDNQLIMKYSDMPVNHMEYLYNLIRERRNGVELGFKSMYAPVWEAMEIFSLKYQFKVSFNKSEDGEKGHLVIEKIPKKAQENMEPATEQANEIPDYQSTDSEDSNSESSQFQPDSQIPTGARTKKPTKKKKSKSQKFCLDKQKLIESISPVLIRKALKNILDFLLKKEEASIIFSDLAPVEARFLENFLGIYNKRVSFRGSLSPACNLILDKMCEFFKEFDKLCKLEVYAAKYDVHTQKREVTFMKVPRYTKTNANQPQKQILAPQMKAKDIRKERLTENREETSIKVENIRVNVENKEEKSKNREKETSMNRENCEKNLSVTNLNKNNTKAENLDATNKQLKAITETKDNKLTDNVKIIEDKLVVLNKGLLKQEIEGIAIPKDAAKSIIPEKKMENPAIAHNRKTDRCLGARKEKLLEAMSTPLESDKAMRMMRLMGWQGGALGARGEGIVEPIIPALDIVRGKGLGHVKVKPKPMKPVKSVKPLIPVKNLQVNENLQRPVNNPQVEEKPAPTKLSVRVENRIHFLESILDLINKDMSIESVTLTYPVVLSKKEKKGFKNIIKNINRRIRNSLTPPENLILNQITRCMDAMPELALDLIVTEDMKELTITKMTDSIEDLRPHRTRRTFFPETINEDLSSRKMSITDFNIYICSIVLEFLKSSDTERWIDFDATLPEKYCDIVEKVSFYVNTKTLIPFKSAQDIARKIMEINDKCFLDVQFDGKPTRSLLLRKFYPRKPSINKVALKNIVQRYTKTVLANKDDINEHRDTEIVRSNSDKEANKENTINVMSNEASNITNPYTDKTCERLNPRNDISKQDMSVSYICIDSVRSYVVDDEEIKENHLKTNEESQCFDNLKLSNHIVNDCKDIKEKTGKTLKRFPLYAKDIIADHNDIRRVDMDLIQVTINSLTTHTENLEDIKIELHENELLAKVHENNAFNISDNPKCTESSKRSDKQDMSCQLSNVRKWYDHSEKFLRCDLDKYTSSVKNIDSNNNRNEETKVEGFKYIGEKVMNIHFDNAKNKDDAMEVVLSNQDDEKQSQMYVKRIEGNDSQDFNPIGAYEGCDGITGSIKTTEWHQAGEQQSVLVTIQEEAKNNEDLKPTNVSEDVIANKTIIDVIESGKVLREFKNHSKIDIISVSDSVNKQVSEVSYNIKDPIHEIELKISNQIETQSKLDVIPIYRDNKENLNNISVNEVCASNIKDTDVIESNQSHQDDEKYSELDIIETTQKESFEAVEVCVNQEDSNKNDLRLTSDFKTVDLKESKNTEEIQSKLEIDYNNGSKHTSENQTKDLKNTNKEINRTYDVVLIKSNILEIEVIQKKIQNTIESIDSEVEFLPLLKYHGIINKGLVYICLNKESSIWLRNILPNYSVIDYRSAINNYKLKIKVASLNEDAKKFLELLEKYNLGLKCQDWNIISKKHYIYTLILCVEVDSVSFEYICNKNFSLFVGYDVAQFSIGC